MGGTNLPASYELASNKQEPPYNTNTLQYMPCVLLSCVLICSWNVLGFATDEEIDNGIRSQAMPCTRTGVVFTWPLRQRNILPRKVGTCGT